LLVKGNGINLPKETRQFAAKISERLLADLAVVWEMSICQAISIIRRRKWSDRWRAMQAAEKIPSRVAGLSTRWNGIGVAISDRRGGFRGPGPGTASGWRPSTSKPNAIP
jgi:hypothetical protein